MKLMNEYPVWWYFFRYFRCCDNMCLIISMVSIKSISSFIFNECWHMVTYPSGEAMWRKLGYIIFPGDCAAMPCHNCDTIIKSNCHHFIKPTFILLICHRYLIHLLTTVGSVNIAVAILWNGVSLLLHFQCWVCKMNTDS